MAETIMMARVLGDYAELLVCLMPWEINQELISLLCCRFLKI